MEDMLVPPYFFFLFRSFDGIKTFHLKLNRQHLSVRPNSETEKSNPFSILDTKVTRECKRFSPSVYHKPSLIEVFSNFESFRLL